MSLLVRAVIAIIVGVLITGLLDHFNLLTPSLDALIGLLAAILVFWQYDGIIHR